MSTKQLWVVQGPVGCRAGYGEMARYLVSIILRHPDIDLRIISATWGSTPMNALNADDPQDKAIIDRIIPYLEVLDRQPDVYIQITIPNEFQPRGKYNIGYTAGIETNLCSIPWIEGCNRMDAVWTISQHSARVFQETVVQQQDPQGNVVGMLRVTKPVEIVHIGIDPTIFKVLDTKHIPRSIDDALVKIKESFCFLYVGHWLNGGVGEDRKNVGLLVKLFCETFKDTIKANRPALILKTSHADFSVIDREAILDKIRAIKDTVGPNCPNVYLLHGDLTKEEMNGLYNHRKIKVHVNMTHGEGCCIPLLEASLSQKPVMASGWSGQLDFLNPDDAILLPGQLGRIPPGAVWPDVIIPESSWFNADPQFTVQAMMYVFKNYDQFTDGAARLAKKNRELFSPEGVDAEFTKLKDTTLPKFMAPPTQVALKLPELKKIP